MNRFCFNGCVRTAIECIQAIADELEACADFLNGGPLTPECIAAGIAAYNICTHAWNDCVGG